MSNFNSKYTFPNSLTQVKDESIGNPANITEYPLHKPFFCIRAAKGEKNKVFWLTGDEAITKYGSETFDQFSEYYRPEQLFLSEAIFPGQACFIARLCAPDAKEATLALECHLTKNVQVQMYERDDDGNYKYDTNGDLIPILDESNNPVKEKGVTLKYVLREVSEDETYDTIKNKTVSSGSQETEILPVIGGIATSPGAFGSRSGFKIYFDPDAQSEDLLEENKALQFTFAPVEQPYQSNLAAAIGDKYEYISNTFVFKPDQVDSNTQRRISFDDMISRVYYDTSNNYLLPYNLHCYTDNIKYIGDAIKEVETNDLEITDGWMVDIFTLLNLKGYSYEHAIFDTTGTDGVYVNDAAIQYFSGGADGDLSDETFEELYRQVLDFTLIPELVDTFKYPITHIYDVGYSIDTKLKMASWMAKHKSSKVEIATQDISRPMYTMDESVSVASAVRTRMALTPESTFYGTEAMRGEIFGQCGMLNDTSIKYIVPATFWIAQKRATLHNASYIKGTVKGYPNNIVNIYREVNFVPFSDDQKQIFWDGAANYFQYANMNDMFFADIRSIYRATSSVLSDTTYTDCCIYTMYILNTVWTYYVGKTNAPVNTLFSDIKKSIESLAYKAYGNLYDLTATVYQTDDDIQAGDQLHIDSVLLGDTPNRRWFNTIIARRPNLTTTTEA